MSGKRSGDDKRKEGSPGMFGRFLEGIPSDLKAPASGSPPGRILRSARTLFARHGFDSTSTRSIAEKAGVNQAMIHYYFGTKEHLYRRVISLEILDVFRAISGELEKEDPSDAALVRVPLEIMGQLRSDPVRRSLLGREIGQGGKHAGQAVIAMREYGPRGFRDLLATLLETGQREGRFRSLPAEAVVPFLLSVAYGSMMLEPLFEIVLGRSVADEDVWRSRSDTFETLLKHGLLAGEKES